MAYQTSEERNKIRKQNEEIFAKHGLVIEHIEGSKVKIDLGHKVGDNYIIMPTEAIDGFVDIIMYHKQSAQILDLCAATDKDDTMSSES